MQPFLISVLLTNITVWLNCSTTTDWLRVIILKRNYHHHRLSIILEQGAVWMKNLNTPLIRNSIICSSSYYNSIKLWNKIPSSLKNFPSLQMFKSYLRKNPDIFWKFVIYLLKISVIYGQRSGSPSPFKLDGMWSCQQCSPWFRVRQTSVCFQAGE